MRKKCARSANHPPSATSNKTKQKSIVEFILGGVYTNTTKFSKQNKLSNIQLHHWRYYLFFFFSGRLVPCIHFEVSAHYQVHLLQKEYSFFIFRNISKKIIKTETRVVLVLFNNNKKKNVLKFHQSSTSLLPHPPFLLGDRAY